MLLIFTKLESIRIRNKVVLLTEDKPEEQTPSGTEIQSNKDEENDKQKNKKTRSRKKSRKSRKKSKPILAVATSDKKEGKPVEPPNKSDMQDSKVERNFDWLL